jgi:hypothetical protein
MTDRNVQIENQLVARPPIHPNMFDCLDPHRNDAIFLYREGDIISTSSGGATINASSPNYRYKLLVVDRIVVPSTRLSYATAVFLIPAGRETEFLFSSKQGLRSIAESAQTARLIAVSFGRMHCFASQQAVQEELTFVVQLLGKQGRFLKANQLANMQAIPFMALDGIGKRNILIQGESEVSGKYLVEQVTAGGQQVRRLYFMNNPFVIQSEVVLSLQQENTTIAAVSVDKSQAAFEYYKSSKSAA